jgi:cell wall-associated NlpC family hydrolase
MSSGTMKSRTEALAIARSYIGTPYVLGGRVKGAGVDCATLLAEYLMEIGATTEAELIEAGFYREGGVGHSFSHDWFCHTERQEYLRGLMMFGKLVAETVCRPGLQPQPGDLVLFRAVGSKRFNHGAIVMAWPRGIHACDGVVRESNLVSHRLTGYKQMDIFDPFERPAAQ